MIYRYRVYGLNFQSDTAVPGCYREQVSSDRPDVFLEIKPERPSWVREAHKLRRSTRPSRPELPDDSVCKVTTFGAEEFFELAYDDGTRVVCDGRAKRLWATYQAPLTIDDLATYLLGPIMGFVLRRRGITALHASAVCIAGQAVVLCGTSQAGKSTTAAALALRGVPVLCEDISGLTEEAGKFHVEPGYPRICLWPDTVEKLLGAADVLPKLTPTWEKCFLPLEGKRAHFESQRRPLGAVYLLAPRATESVPRLEELNPREALLELVQNTYMNYLLDRKQRAAEFDVLSRLVTQTPVRRIVPPADPSRIGALCELILSDAQRLFSTQDFSAAGSHR